MTNATPLHWNFVVHRRDGADVQQLLTEALVVGLEVRHYRSWRTEDWSSLSGEAGLYRGIGNLTFSKTTRRWRVVARADCSPSDLASLVCYGVRVAQRYGSSPGHFTRKREFYHQVFSDGERIATAHCAVKLTTQDLQFEQRTAVDVPDTVHELLSLTA